MRKGLPGLTAHIKEKLIQQSLERKLRQAEPVAVTEEGRGSMARDIFSATEDIPDTHTRFSALPGYQQIRIMNEGASRLGIQSPFFRQHEAVAGSGTVIGGRRLINFGSYNYLGFSGDPRVNAAAMVAIEQYGTSASASRITAGERPVHRELEAALASAHGVEDAVTFVSGHATNVSTIGYLFGPRDLVVHDALIHNSSLQGIALSGAARLSFPHNDWAALDELLVSQRRKFEKVLIVIEGLYSMDGDFPDLPQFVAIKRRHKAFLMVDEAHSLGVLGARGLGIREHFGLPGSDVDIWMGTLSKTLAGCGGYIAGEHALVEHIKVMAPGFLYSVGMPPPVAAASLEALRMLHDHPERVESLRSRGQLFLRLAKEAGIDTGTSTGNAVIPAIVGSSLRTVRLFDALFARGFNMQPIVYPGVPERAARLRFFISYAHTDDEIKSTIDALAEELARI